MLDVEQRRELQTTLQRLLSILAVPADALEPHIIAQAQDQLFAAVRAHCDGAFDCQSRRPAPAVHAVAQLHGPR
jgi:hypothetical protein